IRHAALAQLLHDLVAGVENLIGERGRAVETGSGLRPRRPSLPGGQWRANTGPASRGGRRSRRLSRLDLDQHASVLGTEARAGIGIDGPALGTTAFAHCRTKLRPSFLAR